MIESDINGIPELKNKWFTGLIQIEKDAYDNGNEIKEISKHNLYGVFQKGTDLSALEIMTKITQPSEIFECLESLEGFMFKYTDAYKNYFGNGSKPKANNTNNHSNNDDLDDDLPF